MYDKYWNEEHFKEMTSRQRVGSPMVNKGKRIIKKVLPVFLLCFFITSCGMDATPAERITLSGNTNQTKTTDNGSNNGNPQGTDLSANTDRVNTINTKDDEQNVVELAVDVSNAVPLSKIVSRSEKLKVTKEEEVYQTVSLDASSIAKVKPNIPTGYKVFLTLFLNEDTLVILAYKDDNTSGKVLKNAKYFTYDLPSGKTGMFYEDRTFDNSYYCYATLINNGDIAFKTGKKIFIFDKTSLKLKRKILIPKNVDFNEIILSHNGDKLAFTDERGLIVTTLDFKDAVRLIDVPKWDEKNAMDSIGVKCPLWSQDDKYIYFNMVGYEWGLGIGSMDLESKKVRYIETKFSQGSWSALDLFGDSKNVLCSTEYGERIGILDMDAVTMHSFPWGEGQFAAFNSSPSGYKFYFSAERFEKGTEMPVYSLHMVNYEKKITYKLQDVYNSDYLSTSWSPAGKKAAYIVGDSLYTAQIQ